jgi:hypothetical protein
MAHAERWRVEITSVAQAPKFERAGLLARPTVTCHSRADALRAAETLRAQGAVVSIKRLVEDEEDAAAPGGAPDNEAPPTPPSNVPFANVAPRTMLAAAAAFALLIFVIAGILWRIG